MGTTIRQKTAGKIDADRRRYFATDVVGDVTGMPVDGLRLLANARSLLARPAAGVGAGHLEGSLRCLRPAHPNAPASERLGSGAARTRWQWRSGRPGSAIPGGRF